MIAYKVLKYHHGRMISLYACGCWAQDYELGRLVEGVPGSALFGFRTPGQAIRSAEVESSSGRSLQVWEVEATNIRPCSRYIGLFQGAWADYWGKGDYSCAWCEAAPGTILADSMTLVRKVWPLVGDKV